MECITRWGRIKSDSCPHWGRGTVSPHHRGVDNCAPHTPSFLERCMPRRCQVIFAESELYPVNTVMWERRLGVLRAAGRRSREGVMAMTGAWNAVSSAYGGGAHDVGAERQCVVRLHMPLAAAIAYSIGVDCTWISCEGACGDDQLSTRRYVHSTQVTSGVALRGVRNCRPQRSGTLLRSPPSTVVRDNP